MARETIHVVQAYTRDEDGRLVADTLVPARNELDAKDRPLRLKGTKAGCLPFPAPADIEVGEYDDAVMLAKYGVVPTRTRSDRGPR